MGAHKLLLICVGLLGAVFVCSAAAAGKPNILIIVADDLGYADVGFNGGKTIHTSNLDRLAAEGINLTNFRACPMCSPTRAGLMTGRWPLRFGIMASVVRPWFTNGLPADEQTLPELLSRVGYKQRAIVGKWHLGHARKEFLPLAKGFTTFYGHYNGAIDYFDHTREGEVDWHRDGRTIVEAGYSTDLLAAEAVRFIKQAPAGEPWFLYLPFNAPHEPLEAKPEDLAKYAELKNESRRRYAAMVDCLDQAAGRVLAAVNARPDAANTLVIFFSDNGGIPKVGSSNEPWRGGKLNVYEGGTRVCACIRWSAGGLSGGGKFAGRIGYIDVLPTLLAAAGGKPPQNLDGINLLPVLLHESPLPERPWFSYVHQDESAHASVHEGNWKLVVHGDAFAAKPNPSPTIELYDLGSDPGEKTDCAVSHPDTVARLRQKLREFGQLGTRYAGRLNAGREGFRAPKDWIIER